MAGNGRCAATTKEGRRCKRARKAGSTTCGGHRRGRRHASPVLNGPARRGHSLRSDTKKRSHMEMETGISGKPASVADAVRMSWMSRYPNQTGAALQDRPKKPAGHS